MSSPFYITTPIYYVTDAPHIGHLYTTLAADVLARFHRLMGRDVWFLTGTDEHGQKIQRQAKQNQETPQVLADRVVERYKAVWQRYGVSYNDFIRTTESRHKKVVHAFIEQLMRSGDIYMGEYEGWYCIPDEAYWTETQVVDGKCPDCGRVVERLKEESYFFKMSAYQEKLLRHIEKNPDFIFPESRKNEVVSFVKSGLRDISVSRTTIQWGIPMPKDPATSKEHKVYVWFDALTNYVSALGNLDSDPKFNKYWPHAIHLVGKDILRFHAVYWPTFLMALGLPLPRKIVAHGWLTLSQQKISKSLGNVIEPMALSEEIGVDGVRYFLFREFVFGMDGEYSKETLYRRINADLANDYGNGINRVCSMIEKYLGMHHAEIGKLLSLASPVKDTCLASIVTFTNALEGFHFEKALEAISNIVTSVNRYIENEAPWKLAKLNTSEGKNRLQQVLFHCHEGLRLASILFLPFMPSSAEKALAILGINHDSLSENPLRRLSWADGPKEITIAKPVPLFPRLELPS